MRKRIWQYGWFVFLKHTKSIKAIIYDNTLNFATANLPASEVVMWRSLGYATLFGGVAYVVIRINGGAWQSKWLLLMRGSVILPAMFSCKVIRRNERYMAKMKMPRKLLSFTEQYLQNLGYWHFVFWKSWIHYALGASSNNVVCPLLKISTTIPIKIETE